MAQPVAKRRKLSHSSSDSQSEDGPFASLSENKESDNTGEHNGTFTESDNEVEPQYLGQEEDEEEESSETDSSPNGTNGDEVSGRRKQERPKARHEQWGDGVSRNTAYTGEVFKSNLFKLQVDELLQQVRPKQSQKAPAVGDVLRSLKKIIEDIPSQGPKTVVDAERALRKVDKVAIPFPHPRPPKDANYKLQYAKPLHINTAGSYPLNTNTSSSNDVILDLVVTMPTSIFQDKDYLNHRYFYKRAYYLACLAAGLKKEKDKKFELRFDYLHGNRLLPILIVDLKKSSLSSQNLPCENLRIVVLPSIPEGLFSKEKLLPNKNCVRAQSTVEVDETLTLDATPFYNASLRVDGLVTEYLKLQHQTATQCDAYKDACVLGRIWLRQRGFSGRIQSGGFGNFEWAVLVALLLQGGGPKGTPAFSSGYSSYQLFKATLQYLAAKDLAKNPQMVHGHEVHLPKSSALPVLFDGVRALNILFKMTPWSYKLLQHEARTTVSMLNDSTFDHFDAAFILRTDQPLCRYDVMLEIPIQQLVRDSSLNDFDIELSETCLNLFSTLCRGLSDRVKLVCLHAPDELSWAIQFPSSSTDKGASVLVGLMIDPVNGQRLVDHGPSAEDKKAAASFRTFWGEKAELRRFKDGSILESLVWSAKGGNTTIFCQIVTYIIKRHYGNKCVEAMSYVGDQERALLATGAASASVGTAPFQATIASFEVLQKDIRALDDLPLQIRHILAADPQLSYGSVHIPFVIGHKQATPAEVVIQFEGSARWPDDLGAIQRTKIAFLLKLAELLEGSVENLTARLGLENEESTLLNQSFLDLIYPSGAAFRIRIHHDREGTLIERRIKERSLSSQDRTEAASALAIYRRSFLRQPAHTQAMQILCTRFPALSCTIRLVKKWFAAHFLSLHFEHVFIELLVARCFTNPYPWAAPSSATTGLLRVLVFLSRWDWRSDPWIVDLGAGDMKEDDISAITTRFEAWRKIDPALNRVVLFAASNVDSDGITWTDHAKPPKVLAARMTALAKAAVALVKENGTKLAPECLFMSALKDYDVLIHLDPKFTKEKLHANAKLSKYKNLQHQTEKVDVDSVGYDPIRLFLHDVQAVFGQAMVFFYDECGGDVLAALWNPQSEERTWKLKLGYSTQPGRGPANGAAHDDVHAHLNRQGILNEIARLGGDLVKRIETKQIR